MNFLLNEGKTDSGTSVVNARNIHDLSLPWMQLQSSDIEDYFIKSKGVPYSRAYTGYGLGLYVGTYRGNFIFCH
jgi:hypothetical protein